MVKVSRLPDPAAKSHERFQRGAPAVLESKFPLELPHGVTVRCRDAHLGPPHLDAGTARLWAKTRSAPRDRRGVHRRRG